MKENLREVYQVKIQLNGIRPPIWRRFFISNMMSLEEFHIVCQIIMGWTNSHLHQFIKDGETYGISDPDWDYEVNNEKDFKIKDILAVIGDHVLYEYDFGDSWEHKITLEKVLPFNTEQQLPYCVKGSRNCPPEDVGGIWGYEEFLTAYLDKKHPGHEEMKEWIGEGFDPEAFDFNEINASLAGG